MCLLFSGIITIILPHIVQELHLSSDKKLHSDKPLLYLMVRKCFALVVLYQQNGLL